MFCKVYCIDSQRVVPRPVVSALSGNWEMKILGPRSRSAKSETLRKAQSNLCFHKALSDSDGYRLEKSTALKHFHLLV